MNALNGLKSMVGNDSAGEMNSTSAKNPKNGSGIAASLNAVNTQIEKSENMRMEAHLAIMEAEMKDMLQDPKTKADEKVEAPKTVEAEAGKSKRSLELSRRRGTVSRMRHDIENGAAILKSVAQNADTIFEYLNNSERDLAYLEEIEGVASDLEAEVNDLARSKANAEKQIEELQKQVHILEAKKNQARSVNEELRGSLNKAEADIDNQRTTISNTKLKLDKVEDDFASANEALDQYKSDVRDLWDEKDTLVAENQSLHQQVKDQTKTIFDRDEEIKHLVEDKTAASMDLKEVRGQYKTLADKYAEKKSALEEKSYQLDQVQADYEEKFRLKDAHIFKLESEVNVTGKQVMLADDMIAKLNATLSELRKSGSSESSKRMAEKAKPKQAASKMAAE